MIFYKSSVAKEKMLYLGLRYVKEKQNCVGEKLKNINNCKDKILQ